MSKVIIYTDGGARGNPGPAGAGAVIYVGREKIAEISEFLGKQTNNYAEYEAIVLALKKVKELELEIKDIEVRSDSKLVVEQLSGNWNVKNANVRKQFNKAKKLLENFASIKFVHIPREENAEADMLANLAMDMSK